METVLNCTDTFAKYFNEAPKFLEYSSHQIYIAFNFGIFRVEIDTTHLGSRAYVMIGREFNRIAVFVTPNEQGTSFDEVCKQVRDFLVEHVASVNAVVKSDLSSVLGEK